MTWMITYAASSTLIALLAVTFENRFRPEWREALLWFAAIAPLLIASLSFIEPTQAGPSGFSPIAPTIAISLPSDLRITPGETLDVGLIVFVVWTVVAFLMLGRDLILHRRLIVALDRKPATSDTLDRVASRMRMRRGIELTKSASLPVPIAIGSHEICVPSDFLESAGHDDLEPIFAHELAHLRRRDPQLQQIARLISVILWWQPLNRVIAGRLAAAAELRADVLCSSVVEPTRIARTLVLFAQQTRAPRVAGMPAFPAGLLTERVAHLLSDNRPVSGLLLRLAVCALLGLGGVAIAPRFAILSARIPAMFSPLVVRASQFAAAPVVEESRTAKRRARPPMPASAEPGEQDVIGTLATLLNDSEKHVRSAARESLRKIGTPASLAALANDRHAQEAAMKEIR